MINSVHQTQKITHLSRSIAVITIVKPAEMATKSLTGPGNLENHSARSEIPFAAFGRTSAPKSASCFPNGSSAACFSQCTLKLLSK